MPITGPGLDALGAASEIKRALAGCALDRPTGGTSNCAPVRPVNCAYGLPAVPGPLRPASAGSLAPP
jgi:hypothetical protein